MGIVSITEDATLVRVDPGGGIARVADALDVDLTGIVDGDALTWDAGAAKLVPGAGGGGGGGGSVAVQEGDTTVVATASVIDFAAADFDVTESPLGEANIAIAAGIARDTEVTSAIAALSSVYQPLDAELTAVAALATTAFGRALLELADAAALLAAAGGADASHTHDHGSLSGLSDDDHSQYPVIAPAATARNTIQPTGPAVSPLVVKAAASQSSALTQWQNSAGTVLSRVKAGGGVDAVTEAAAVPALIAKGATSQTAALQEWQNSAGTVLAAIGAAGFLEMLEQTAPAAPASNKARLYTRDDGAGVTQLVVMFPSGNVVVIAEDF